MDFGALPPEINSARMYAGPGSGSMLAAAAAWDDIADDLYLAAGRCDAVVAQLAGADWLGAASVAMVTATAPYLSWLNATAAQALQAAAQARAAAGAFEAAFAATVPPPVIAANRLLLATLTATNVLGVNTPAIAATEAQYLQMWAQDAAAMYGYAAASAVASTLTPFTPPTAITDAADAATSASRGVPQALQQLAQPLQSSASNLSALVSPAGSCISAMSSSMSATSSLSSVVKTLSPSAALAAAVDGAAKAPALPGMPGWGFGAPPMVSAALARAVPIGQLSVPQSWAGAAVTPGAVEVAGAGAGGAQAVGRSDAGNMFGGLPIAGLTPREGGPNGAVPRAGLRPTVLPREGVGG